MIDYRDQLVSELQAEDDYGVLLAAQLDAVPNTLQLMVQTAKLDPSVNGLRPRGQYTIRAIGVEEHSLSLGVFGRFLFTEDHPILYWINTPTVGVFFRGTPRDVHELLIDLQQAHVSTFARWRHFPEYFNIAQPITTLLTSGGGLLGEMPKPLAERVEKVLQHHQLETKLMEAERHAEKPLFKALVIDQGYVIAQDFTVDPLGRPKNA